MEARTTKAASYRNKATKIVTKLYSSLSNPIVLRIITVSIKNNTNEMTLDYLVLFDIATICFEFGFKILTNIILGSII